MDQVFLFTDIQQSTRLWAEYPDEMAEALGQHNVMIRRAVSETGGRELSNAGDGVLAAFADPRASLVCAVEIQRWLAQHEWQSFGHLSVRIGLHAGEPVRLETGEYGGPVLNETARLHDAGSGGQVLVSRTLADLIGDDLPAGCSLLSLGLQHLPDVAPSEILQLCHPDLGRDFPPLRTALNPGQELVGRGRSFVGRDHELRDLMDLSGSRLLTLTGPGGVGKTRLAQILLGRRASHYSDGAVVVDLAAVSRSTEVAPAIATTLLIEYLAETDFTEQHIVERIRRWLRPKNMLILLDNCEHVIDSVREIATTIISNAPGVALICTSRQPLSLTDESVFGVDPLRTEMQSDSDEVSPAVQLFVDRARYARPQFRPNRDELLQIERICREVDGLPLALELAAARVSINALDEIRTLLEMPDAGERRQDAADRHTSMRALVEWSYDLLSPHEQLLFARLGVFPGPFSRDAASTICGAEWEPIEGTLEDVLASLVDKSILVRDSDNQTFRLLAPMRAFANSTLSDSENDLNRSRFVAYYADFATDAGAMLQTKEENRAAVSLESQFSNIRAAHRRALESGQAHAGARIVAALRVFAVHRFQFEVAMWSEASLADERTPEHLRPELHGLCGVRAWMRGDLKVAKAHADHAVEIEDRHGLPPSIYSRLVRLAVAGYEERFEDAMTEFEVAHRQARRERDPSWEIEVLVFSAVGMAVQGAYELAAAIALQAHALLDKNASPTSRAWIDYALAESVHHEDPELAIDFLERAVSASRSVRNEWILGLAQASLARQLRRSGRVEACAVVLMENLDRWSRAGNWSEQWRAIREVGALCTDIGRNEDAITLLAAIDKTESVVPVSPDDRVELDGLFEKLQTDLGDAAFARLSKRGRLLVSAAPDSLVEQARHALGTLVV